MTFLVNKSATRKRCAATRAEQKLRCRRNGDARVCEAHFCSMYKFCLYNLGVILYDKSEKEFLVWGKK